MEETKQSLRQRIPNEKRRECLKLFEGGMGYKKTAKITGLNPYSVRDYKALLRYLRYCLRRSR